MNDETNYQLKYWKAKIEIAKLEAKNEMLASYIGKRNEYVDELLKQIEELEC